MDPRISELLETGDVMEFRLSGVHMCFANAIRRLLLSEIPVICIRSETEAVNQCRITKNTSRLHNEILKQRLSSIPVHSTNLEEFPGKYELEVAATNDTDNMMFVTTELFRIKNKETGAYVSREKTAELFPSNDLTHDFIVFARLRPKYSDTIPGEEIALTADFSVSNAKENSMFNVVSKCSYANTMDAVKGEEAWELVKAKMEGESATPKEIEFQARNFKLLDAQRYFVADSFDFIIQTVGVYENSQLVKLACSVLQKKVLDFMEGLEADTVPIQPSDTTMENSIDVVLEGEDYTLGKMLEYVMYERFYMGDKTLSYCAFKKFHPHNTESILRFAFHEKTKRNERIKSMLKATCMEIQELFVSIYKMF